MALPLLTRTDWAEGKRVLKSMRAELRAGTRHYGRDGRELTTASEIAQELLDRGKLSHIDLPDGRPIPDYLRQA